MQTNNGECELDDELTRQIRQNERAFKQGFSDCIIDCIICMIEQENFNPNDDVLREMVKYLVGKLNGATSTSNKNDSPADLTNTTASNINENKIELIEKFINFRI